jgi:hypothetical protein
MVLWLGTYLSRLLLTYQLFMPKDFILKSFVSPLNLGGILTTINSSVTVTLILFPVFFLSFILFLFTSKVNLKQEGWLFIILLIVFITAPFEAYLMTIDYNIVMKVFYGNFDPNQILQLYIKRLKVLGSFPLIEIFSYFGVVYFAIFQPLKMKK